MQHVEIGQKVVRSKGDYVVGRIGEVVEIDNEKKRARVYWLSENLRTWVKFDVIEDINIPLHHHARRAVPEIRAAMKRIIERRTNVDFCKRVEVWQGYRIIDRYLTIPGWKLEGFTAVNPRTDTPIFGKTWGNNYEGFLSNLAIQSRTSSCPRLRGGGIWTTSAANEYFPVP